jgi:hypothetical protein
LDVDTTAKKFDKLRAKHLYFNWLLNLNDFDYAQFDPEWLLIYNVDSYTNKFKTVENLKIEIEKALKRAYNPELAKIYHQFIQ